MFYYLTFESAKVHIIFDIPKVYVFIYFSIEQNLLYLKGYAFGFGYR